MNLSEMFDKSTAQDDPSEDHSRPKLGDVRKTKLTLAAINRLRMMNDVRKWELEQELNDVKLQYGAKPEDQGGM